MTLLPKFLHIKVAPFQAIHFLGKTHTADENGILRNVPYDAAKTMIDDPKHPAIEAPAEVDAEPAAAEPEKPAKAAKAETAPKAKADTAPKASE